MKNGILKKISCTIIMLLIIFIMSTISEAATLTMKASNDEITIGETFTVKVTAGNGAGRIDFSATNATLSSSSEFLDKSSTTITVTPKSTGKVTVKATGVLSDFTKEEDQDFSESVSVTVKEKVVEPQEKEPEPEETKPEENKQEEPKEDTPPTTVTIPEEKPPQTTTTTQPTEPTKSSNAYLESLTASQEGLTPAFNRGTTDYVLNVGNDVESIEVNAVAEHSKARVTVSGNTELIEGENSVKVVVKAEDGTTKTYNITVIKAEKINMFLDKLEILGVSEEKNDILIVLTPEFKPETFEYTINLDENIKSLNINATSMVDDAIIEITGNENLTEGQNLITITLKMPEGEEKIEYKITANKAVSTVSTIAENKLEEEKTWFEENKAKIIIAGTIILVAIVIIIIISVKYRNTKIAEEFVDRNDRLKNLDEQINSSEKKTEKSGKHF